MEKVQTVPKSYDDYVDLIDIDTRLQLEYYTDKLRGKKIAMVNATAFGGGIAEMLHSFVPLANSLGILMDWWVIVAAQEFYLVTKTFHNCLQGKEGKLSSEAKEIYFKYNQINSEPLKDWDYDYMVIHDPQPAALIDYRVPGSKAKWIWRCHIDTSTPNAEYWEFIAKFIRKYDSCIFTVPDYVKENESLPRLTFITPSIDPLSKKNIYLEKEEARKILARFGMDINRPLISQISRFDPWKDPLGVIDAYRIIKKEFPSVQLALVGSMATDDPEGWDYLYRTLRRAGEDYDIKVVTNFDGVSSLEVNAFQRASDVILQKSIKESFGLTVAEGMWKETPVIGGNVGGIKYQIDDGVNGFLVDSVEDCAKKSLRLLRNPMIAEEISKAGKEKVRQNFLVTTGLLNYLQLFDRLGGY